MANKIRNLMDDPMPFEGGGSGGGSRSSGSYLKSQKAHLTAAGVGTAATVGTIYKDMKNAQDEREAAAELKRESRGVRKNSTDLARDEAQEMNMLEQTDKASRAASKDMGFAKGGSASSRADGIATKGKTRGTIIMCGGGMYKK
jgi:hypothetical protein